MKISIAGWAELRSEVGDERALQMLREVVKKIPEYVERDLRTGGRVVTEYDIETGKETIRIRPSE